MTTVILNAQTEKSSLQHYTGQIQLFLYDLTCDYPFFGEWLKKVLSEIKTGKRQIVIMTDEGNSRLIVGLTILKTEQQEKKICTIRVAKEYQRHGYGTELVRKSLEILKTNNPLVTVSEKHIDVFRLFFSKFGFRVVGKVKSLYHEGEYEYFFNFPYLHRDVLMSIKPKYADAIFKGEKRVEFRKVCFKETVTHVYVYSSTPIRQIIGYFTIERIEKDSPEKLWNRYSSVSAIQREEFFNYFSGVSRGYAIVVKDIHPFKNGLTIQDVFSSNYVVPQNYRYIDNVSTLHYLKTQNDLAYSV